MKNAVFITVPLAVTLFIVLLLAGNAYTPDKYKCKHISGIVTGIYKAGTKDAVFKLAGQSTTFYINRGLAKNFSLKSLLEKLKGREVTILYADNFNPLGSIGSSRHVAEMSVGTELLYSEFPEPK